MSGDYSAADSPPATGTTGMASRPLGMSANLRSVEGERYPSESPSSNTHVAILMLRVWSLEKDWVNELQTGHLQLSGRHCGIASLVFSHRGSSSQSISAARTRIARTFASHRIAISMFSMHLCSHRIAARIARYGPLRSSTSPVVADNPTTKRRYSQTGTDKVLGYGDWGQGSSATRPRSQKQFVKANWNFF